MDKAKLIENIKSQLKSLMTNEVKFAEIKAGDLMISSPDEELVIGSEVFVIDQDGNNVPLTDGDYTLDSGETISVSAGKVETIANAQPEVEAPEEVVAAKEDPMMDPEADPNEAETPEETKKEGGSEEVKALAARIAKCEAMLEEMSKMNNKMEQELSKVGALPSTSSISVEPSEFKSVEDKKSNFGSVDIMSIREKARRGR
jgi:hypothetical protein